MLRRRSWSFGSAAEGRASKGADQAPSSTDGDGDGVVDAEAPAAGDDVDDDHAPLPEEPEPGAGSDGESPNEGGGEAVGDSPQLPIDVEAAAGEATTPRDDDDNPAAAKTDDATEQSPDTKNRLRLRSNSPSGRAGAKPKITHQLSNEWDAMREQRRLLLEKRSSAAKLEQELVEHEINELTDAALDADAKGMGTRGQIFERMNDLLAETAIYAVGNDQKAARWKPPKYSLALEARRRALWRGGKESLQTSTRALGEMGIGMELYFYVMRNMAKLFTYLTVLHLPLMLLHARAWKCRGSSKRTDYQNSICSSGSSTDSKSILFRMTLGDDCRDGVEPWEVFRASAWRAVGVAPVMVSPSPKALAAFLCAVQLATTVLVLYFTISLKRHVHIRLMELSLQHTSPSQFSVLVTNVPSDVDERELLRHFSRRYDLTRRQIRYPIYGLSVKGACVLSAGLTASLVAAVTAAALAGTVGQRYSPLTDLELAVAAAVVLACATVAGVSAHSFAHRRRLGRPESIPPLREEHDQMRRSWLRSHNRWPWPIRRYIERYRAEAETNWLRRTPDPRPVSDMSHRKVTEDNHHHPSASKAAHINKKRLLGAARATKAAMDKQAAAAAAGAGAGAGGGAAEDSDLRPGVLPAVRYDGKWVADVSLIRSNGELIRQYMEVRQLWAKVQVSRAEVRRWSESHSDTPHMGRCRAALNRLEVLVERMKDAQRELSRSVDRKGIDEVTGAFVTFEYEWSAFRCLEDYRHSRQSLLRRFQPLNFQLHRRAKGSSLAPDAVEHPLYGGPPRPKQNLLVGNNANNNANNNDDTTEVVVGQHRQEGGPTTMKHSPRNSMLKGPFPSMRPPFLAQQHQHHHKQQGTMTIPEHSTGGREPSVGTDRTGQPMPILSTTLANQATMAMTTGGRAMSCPLAVKPAPSPDDVLWENLGVPSNEKVARRLTTLFFSVVLLLCTSVIAGYKIAVGRELDESKPTLGNCREALASQFGTYDLPGETCELLERIVTTELSNETACPDGESFVGFAPDLLTYERTTGLGAIAVVNDTAAGVVTYYDTRADAALLVTIGGPPTNAMVTYRDNPNCGASCVQPTPPLLRADGASTLARSLFSVQVSDNLLGHQPTLCDSPCYPRRGPSTRDRCDNVACVLPSWSDPAAPAAATNNKNGTVEACATSRADRFERTTLPTCYCELKLARKRMTSMSSIYFRLIKLKVAAAFSAVGRHRPWQLVCRSYISQTVELMVADRALVFAIVLVNTLIFLVFSLFERFERHNSVSSSLVNTASKTFILTFLNTAFINPLFNAKCSDADAWARLGLGWVCHTVLLGDHTNLSRYWYSDVGATLVQTVLLNMAVSLFSRFWLVFGQRPLLTAWFKSSCVTQTQLDALLLPPRFDIETRFGYGLTYILTCLLYCGGLPVLLPLAAAYFWATYFADRFLVLRLYARPPSYDEKLPLLVLRLLPFATVTHLVGSATMYANADIVEAGDFDDQARGSAARDAPRILLLRAYTWAAHRLLSDSTARDVSRTCVAPLVLTALAYVAIWILLELSKIYNLELFPFFSCAKLGMAWSEFRGRVHDRVAWTTATRRRAASRVAPADSVLSARREPETWRRQSRCITNASKATRPGFTEAFRFLAPAGVNYVEHARIEQALLDEPSTATSTATTSSTSAWRDGGADAVLQDAHDRSDKVWRNVKGRVGASAVFNTVAEKWTHRKANRAARLEAEAKRQRDHHHHHHHHHSGGGHPHPHEEMIRTLSKVAHVGTALHVGKVRPQSPTFVPSLDAPVGQSPRGATPRTPMTARAGTSLGPTPRAEDPRAAAARAASAKKKNGGVQPLSASFSSAASSPAAAAPWLSGHDDEDDDDDRPPPLATHAASRDEAYPTIGTPTPRGGGWSLSSSSAAGATPRKATLRSKLLQKGQAVRRRLSQSLRTASSSTTTGGGEPGDHPLFSPQDGGLSPPPGSEAGDGSAAVHVQASAQKISQFLSGRFKQIKRRSVRVVPAVLVYHPHRRDQNRDKLALVMYARKWTKAQSAALVKDGWRLQKAPFDEFVETGLPRGLAKQPAELCRVHRGVGPRRGLPMRTWEMIAFDSRLFSYDIMANPRYRLALEFLESVGTFRPKRELVKEIGLFSEQVFQLQDRCRQNALEKLLTNRTHDLRMKRIHRREQVKVCLERLVSEVELRVLREAMAAAARDLENRLRQERLASQASKERALRKATSIRACVDWLVAEVERRDFIRRLAKERRAATRRADKAAATWTRDVVAAHLAAMIAAVERRAARDSERTAAVRACLDALVARVEGRVMVAEVTRLRRDRDDVKRRVRTLEHQHHEAGGVTSAKYREMEARHAALEHQLKLQETTMATMERVALMAEKAAEREARYNEDHRANVAALMQQQQEQMQQMQMQMQASSSSAAAAAKNNKMVVDHPRIAGGVHATADSGVQTDPRGEDLLVAIHDHHVVHQHQPPTEAAAAKVKATAMMALQRAASFSEFGTQVSPRVSDREAELEREAEYAEAVQAELHAAYEASERLVGAMRVDLDAAADRAEAAQARQGELEREKAEVERALHAFVEEQRQETSLAFLTSQEAQDRARRHEDDADDARRRFEDLAAELRAERSEGGATRARLEDALAEADEIRRYADAARLDADMAADRHDDLLAATERRCADQIRTAKEALDDLASELSETKRRRHDAERALQDLEATAQHSAATAGHDLAAARRAVDAANAACAAENATRIALETTAENLEHRTAQQANELALERELMKATLAALTTDHKAAQHKVAQLTQDRDDADSRCRQLERQLQADQHHRRPPPHHDDDENNNNNNNNNNKNNPDLLRELQLQRQLAHRLRLELDDLRQIHYQPHPSHPTATHRPHSAKPHRHRGIAELGRPYQKIHEFNAGSLRNKVWAPALQGQ